ncbi:MAG: twin-arginine translocase TatA/TatE family subunit [Planctomycetota bacterium]
MTPPAVAVVFLALPGPTELWVILAVILLFVGGRKLPELARAMGSSITQFKKGMKEDPPPIAEGDDGPDGTKDA